MIIETSCKDWEERILSGRSIIPPPIFPEEAEAGLEVMKSLKIVDAPGSPTIGEACAPWVMDFAAAVFGSYNVNTGNRLISEVFLTFSSSFFNLFPVSSGIFFSFIILSIIRLATSFDGSVVS